MKLCSYDVFWLALSVFSEKGINFGSVCFCLFLWKSILIWILTYCLIVVSTKLNFRILLERLAPNSFRNRLTSECVYAQFLKHWQWLVFILRKIDYIYCMKSVAKPAMTVACFVPLGLVRFAVLLWRLLSTSLYKYVFFPHFISHVELSHLPQNSERYKFTELLLVFCSPLPTFKYRESARFHLPPPPLRHTNALFTVKKCKFNFRLCSYIIPLRPFVLIAANLPLVVNYYYCRFFFLRSSPSSNDLFSFRAMWRRWSSRWWLRAHAVALAILLLHAKHWLSHRINFDKSLNTVMEIHCVVFWGINFNFYAIRGIWSIHIRH